MKKLKRIVEWDTVTYHGKPLRDNVFQWIILLYMVPVVGQIIWLINWILIFPLRKVYWIETSDKQRSAK